MRELNQGERTHQRIWELLPWHANGSLAEREREMVESHLAVCPNCRDEEEACRRTAAAVKAAGDGAPSPHPVQLQRMLARIDESEREEQSGGGWWRGRPLRAVIEAAPGPLLRALIAQAAIILLLVGTVTWLAVRARAAPPGAAPATYVTLSDPAAVPGPTVGLRAMFSPQASEREIRQLLLGIRGQITAGPSAIGVYTIEVPADGDPVEVVLARLRSEPQVAFAEPVGGNETGRESR
ncbi:MAG TPA: zf-HC2 domain-containing protein [Thermoanaerobaculia bacterium]|jgi:anti-sigma factor RsiW|nr:zf-HC2 domain-containing protein [Thermoanaerobaculia bacterium]